jgi:hypothetical protein
VDWTAGHKRLANGHRLWPVLQHLERANTQGIRVSAWPALEQAAAVCAGGGAVADLQLRLHARSVVEWEKFISSLSLSSIFTLVKGGNFIC